MSLTDAHLADTRRRAAQLGYTCDPTPYLDEISRLKAQRDAALADLTKVETYHNQALRQRDKALTACLEARAIVHMGHSGDYASCLRKPCIDWRNADEDVTA
jgi:hypothetical protein